MIAARRAYKGPLEVIPSDAILSRLIAQNLHHYGLSIVFNELLSHSQNNNLYVQELPEMEGKSLFELKPLFPRAIIFGVVREKEDDFVPLLNPGIEFTIKNNDRLILLARNLDDVEITPDSLSKKSEFEKLPNLQHKKQRSSGDINGSKNLLVLGWNHQVPALIRELGTYTNETFQLTLASLRTLEDRKKSIDHILETNSNVKCTHIVADYIRESELRSLNPSSFDHILFLSSDRLPDDEEADARTIVGYTLLEEVLESAGKHPQIIMELTDPGNEMLIKNFKSESIIGPLILSNLLATIAMRRELYTVYEELFTVDGAEIIFKRLVDYNLTPRKIKFRELENHIAGYSDTILGYYREDEEGIVDLQLNIRRDKIIDLQTNDRLVVLSTINSGK
jgi:Trk K+ transport system NAD-binding subunit